MMNVGIDMDNVERFKINQEDQFIKNTFTPAEIKYAFSKDIPAQTLCGLFCAKEAMIKTLDRQDILLKEIEVSHDPQGRPNIEVIKADFTANERFSLSISHSGAYAIAIVLRTTNDY